MSDIQEYVRMMAERHARACEKLTTEQLSDALKQALECGDFERHVDVWQRHQAVTYVPARHVERLRSEVARLTEGRDRYRAALEKIKRQSPGCGGCRDIAVNALEEPK